MLGGFRLGVFEGGFPAFLFFCVFFVAVLVFFLYFLDRFGGFPVFLHCVSWSQFEATWGSVRHLSRADGHIKNMLFFFSFLVVEISKEFFLKVFRFVFDVFGILDF